MTQRSIPILPASRAAGGDGPRLASLPPLSLYVHFPWCVKKCPYCDFNSHEARGGIPEGEYVAALIADLEQSLPAIWGRPVVSVFIGGGTPSLLSPQSVDELLSACRARLPLLPEAEITLEANPGTVDTARFAGYRAAGVNRLSLGVQSFDPRHLAALGRIHDEREARQAVDAALRHFDNVNLDMMYALPGQTLAEAQADIRAAAACGTPHLSAYHLTLEPNTPFFHAPPRLPEPDLAADMQDMVEETLACHGYRHYEVSAFAKGLPPAPLPAEGGDAGSAAHGAASGQPAGAECRHNLNYWRFGDYLGIGAGAHGKISRPDGIVREVRQRHPQAYLQSVATGRAVQEPREVTAAELPFEFMLYALRLVEGFAAPLFEERTGLPLHAVRPQLEEATARGLLAVTAGRIAPTGHGRRFLNDLLEIFLAESAN